MSSQIFLNRSFFGYMPKIGITWLYENSILHFWRNSHTIFHSGSTKLLSHQHRRKVLFHSHPLEHSFADFNGGHSDQCEVLPRCSFDLHFCNNLWCWTHFYVPNGHLYVYFGILPIFLIGLFVFVIEMIIYFR